jgi:DNA repair protein RecO (recombination protein O)
MLNAEIREEKMSYLRTKGIVIKETNTGEADRIVTIFSNSKGKISAAAKGSKRPKSRLAAGTQLLCYSDFILFKGSDIYSINTCDIIEPFYELRNDIVRLTHAAHITDIINDVIQENQPSPRVLQLYLNTLYILSKTQKSPELVTRIFELRLLSMLGYAPYVNGCIQCGSENLDGISFSFHKCGFVCGRCKPSDESAMEISTGTAKALYYIVHANIGDLFKFGTSPEVLRELGIINRRYLRERLEHDYTKLDFLRSINL